MQSLKPIAAISYCSPRAHQLLQHIRSMSSKRNFATARSTSNQLASARLRTPGRRRPSGQPRRPPRQGRGPALHLYKLPGRPSSPRRAHRRDPEDGQPDADARAGAVRHHHHGPRARHAGGDAAVRVGTRARSRQLDLPDYDARPAGGCHAEARRALWSWIHRDHGWLSDPRRCDAHHRPRRSLAGELPRPGIRADQPRRLRQRARERRGRPHAHEPQSFWEAIRGWF